MFLRTHAKKEPTADTRTNLIKSVSRWNFEPHKLPDEQAVSCAMVLFEALYRIEGMREFVGVDLRACFSLSLSFSLFLNAFWFRAH
jgi:hypothetical protein